MGENQNDLQVNDAKLDKRIKKWQIWNLRIDFVKKAGSVLCIVLSVFCYVMVRMNIPTRIKHFVNSVASSSNSPYSLNLVWYRENVSGELFKRAKESIEGAGFSVDNTLVRDGIPPNWLAKEPTVLYYDEGTKATAKHLAETLSRATGKSFTCKRGAGYKVPKNEYHKSFRVHLVL